MHILEASFLLIGLVILSNILSHYLVSIPTALIEVGVGLLVAIIFKIRIDLEADWFMLLFVAPLLYNDAKRFPKKDLWELRAPIFANAIFLVLITTVVGGYLIHLIIPGIPLALSMALIAVLSPTDPVAVHGIAERVKLPPRLLNLISGESLINDASGLIAFKYALAAFLTGQFSIFKATGDFLYMSLLGIFIGLILVRVLYSLRATLLQQGIRDVVLHTTIMLISPFVIFIVAELLHASGVIAVVTAGVSSIRLMPLYRGVHSEVQLVTNRMWDILVYLLNGAVFVILGAELPIAMQETLENPQTSNWLLIGYILIIWFILLVLRVLWSYGYLWISYFLNKKENKKPYFNTALLTGLTGVRGAITMATIMSLPFYTPSGNFFQQRSLVIFLACGVVLVSLLVATITLPILTKQRKRLMLAGDKSTLLEEKEDIHEEGETSQLTEMQARAKMLAAAVSALRLEEPAPEDQLVVSDIIHDFEMRLRHIYREQTSEGNGEFFNQTELNLRKKVIAREYITLKQLLDSQLVSQKSYDFFKRQLDIQSKSLDRHLQNFFSRFWQSITRRARRMKILFSIPKASKENPIENDLLTIEKTLSSQTIRFLRDYRKTLDFSVPEGKMEGFIVDQIIDEHRNLLERLKHLTRRTSATAYQVLFQEYYMKALDAERNSVQELYENGKINLTLANRLRQSINFSETTILQNAH